MDGPWADPGLAETTKDVPLSTHLLPEVPPASQGVDARGVHAFLDAIEQAPEIEPHSLMIIRHGRLVASGWWAPYSPERLHLLYSLSKSFTSTAAGFAVAEGLVSLDDPVISYFPEFEADITSAAQPVDARTPHRGDGQSGHDEETLERAIEADPDDRSSADSCWSRRTASPAPSSPTTSPAPTRSPPSSSG